MSENGHPTNGATAVKLTRQDFVTNQEVRWCPGCGDYSILAQVQKVMPELGVDKEKIVFISGIGCSSRFPYYMNTYGFHTIHGRAPAIATGVKTANPDLQVWVITGDGDALSIGGNHFIHALRRNIDLKIILFNNRIYGLTKGQYSPTSELGKINKSAPMGTIDYPLNPLSIGLAAEATFIGRSMDVDPKHLGMNCNIFNDGAFKTFNERDVRDDRMLYLEHGKPLLFGKNKDKGIRLNSQIMEAEIVTVGENGVTTADLLVHDENSPRSYLAYMLGRFQYPDFPVPMGVFRQVLRPTYEQMLAGQINSAIEKKGPGDLNKLLNSGETWVIN
jgi:2-oxoglutarate/2-oxoacid ferredoxin oxidoreductase subunit beta